MYSSRVDAESEASTTVLETEGYMFVFSDHPGKRWGRGEVEAHVEMWEVSKRCEKSPCTCTLQERTATARGPACTSPTGRIDTDTQGRDVDCACTGWGGGSASPLGLRHPSLPDPFPSLPPLRSLHAPPPPPPRPSSLSHPWLCSGAQRNKTKTKVGARRNRAREPTS